MNGCGGYIHGRLDMLGWNKETNNWGGGAIITVSSQSYFDSGPTINIH